MNNQDFSHLEHSARQRWMAALARASTDHLETAWAKLAAGEAITSLRPPETGMVMTQGRAGGNGQRFNLGEMTVTRATVKLTLGEVGHAYVAGRNKRHAELAAAFDALLQRETAHAMVECELITPLLAAQAARREKVAKQASATKVDFFTMARGED
ncbi:MAG: phosphonate C-P lyase system protein PhnG [Orrella sp.]